MSFLEGLPKNVLPTSNHLLSRKRVTKTGTIPSDTLKKRCITSIFMRVTHVTPCDLPNSVNQHSQRLKNYNNNKLGNKIEGDTEDSTVQSSKDIEIELISRKVRRKMKEKVFKRIN